MVQRSAYDKFIADPERRRLVEQESLMIEATECLWEILRRDKVSRAELARRLGKSPAYVTQVLDGQRNMTLRTLADFLFALGYSARIVVDPLADIGSEATSEKTHQREPA